MIDSPIKATATEPDPELRGRAIGVTVLSFFALAWLGWGTGGHLPNGPQVGLMVLAATVSIAVSVYAWSLFRRGRPVPVDRAMGVDVGRSFGLIVAAEWIGLGVVAGVLGGTGHPNVIPAVIAAGVGIHFVPLARLFHVREYYATAALLCLIAIATLIVASATSTPPLWTLLPGLGSSVVLYATCAVLLQQSRAIGAEASSPHAATVAEA
jgi:hypothetical protein